MNRKPLILFIGGARSGKSALALRHAEEHFNSRVFVATARILDEEMAERVRRHKAARGSDWHLLEEPIELPEILETRCAPFDVVLVDCATVWLSNILIEKGEEQLEFYEKRLLGALSSRQRAVIVVSNEVGLGVVPESPLGRRFRDAAGRLNQEIAAAADKVVFTAAGIPLCIKGNSDPKSGRVLE